MCSVCSAKSLPGNTIGIPIQGILDNNFGSLLTWAWCINDSKVKAAFKSATGLDIDQNDLAILIQSNKMGGDVKKYNVNFLDVINAIQFTAAERDNASCPYMLTV